MSKIKKTILICYGTTQAFALVVALVFFFGSPLKGDMTQRAATALGIAIIPVFGMYLGADLTRWIVEESDRQ